MNKEPLDDLFVEVLREGNPSTLWTLLDPDGLSSAGDNMALFSDPPLAEALDRFIERHRPAIAMAYSRCILRRMRDRFGSLIGMRIGTRSTLAESRTRIKLSAPETT